MNFAEENGLKRYANAIFLFSIIILCYSNTFYSPWQLDDYPNIVENFSIHIDNLWPKTLWSTLFSKPFFPGQIERPISFLTFAINWYFGQDNTFGYHIVNLAIHIATSIYIYKSSILLLESQKNEILSKESILSISLLSAVLWAINPIQIQAVTYIVQRMASMGAMFCILSIYHYIRARQTVEKKSILINLLFCITFISLALGCKENTITIFPSLTLLELLFFNKKNDKISFYFKYLLIICNIIILILTIHYAIKTNILSNIFSTTGDRPFTIYERLITQPRVILYYLSQIFYPLPDRFSIDHDLIISKSLINPISTSISLILIVSIVTSSILTFKKYKLLNFSILFFFINHLIESTIIPLEVLFEHRNYLPSFFLFLPISKYIVYNLNFYKTKNKNLFILFFTVTTAILFFTCISTYIRNSYWHTEESLWTDALKKAPNSARPYAKVAEIFGWKKEKDTVNFNIAISLLIKSINKDMPRKTLKVSIINNIGKLYALNGNLKKAIEYYRYSLSIDPNFINSRYDLSQALFLEKKYHESLNEINIILNERKNNTKYLKMKGLILLRLENYEDGYECFRKSMLLQNSFKIEYFKYLGFTLNKLRNYEKGKWFLNIAHQKFPDDLHIILSLIENSLLSNSPDDAKKYTMILINKFSLNQIFSNLNDNESNIFSLPFDVILLKNFISNYTQKTLIFM